MFLHELWDYMLRMRLCLQKALNLKSGANTITFSLSASGVIACTARIFLWESTDLVVISDIDGTITKCVYLCLQIILSTLLTLALADLTAWGTYSR